MMAASAKKADAAASAHGGDDGGRRGGGRAAGAVGQLEHGVGGDRRDHQLHEHVEPERDDRAPAWSRRRRSSAA